MVAATGSLTLAVTAAGPLAGTVDLAAKRLP